MLIDLYSLVESVIGSTLIIWGLALIVNKNIIKSFFDTFINLEKNETLSYLTSSMFLILGLIIVWVHNDWYWSPTIIVTLIGWIITIKASLWLFFPKIFISLAKRFSFIILYPWFHLAYGLCMILFGLLIIGKYYLGNLITFLS